MLRSQAAFPWPRRELAKPRSDDMKGESLQEKDTEMGSMYSTGIPGNVIEILVNFPVSVH